MAEDCVFCGIVAGQEPASFLYRDDAVAAFMDIQPIHPGHLLVIPRQHGELMHHFNEMSLARVWQVVMRMNHALRSSGLPCEGVNIFVADGEAAFQDVMHFHVHVIPRTSGDGFGLTFPATYTDPTPRSQLEAYASAIRAHVPA